MMTADDIISSYGSLKLDEQTRLLINLAWELTITGREAYGAHENSVENPRCLRMVNELQHQILGHQRKLLMGSQERFPDDVLFAVLFQIADVAGYKDYFCSAYETSLKKMGS